MEHPICPTCNQPFVKTNPGQKFCCKEHRTSVQNMVKHKKDLLAKEGPRYTQLANLLKAKGIAFEFEYIFEYFIFDLCLPKLKILVEFQGSGHLRADLQKRDYKKAWLASAAGWTVLWMPLDPGAKIPVEWARKLL